MKDFSDPPAAGTGGCEVHTSRRLTLDVSMKKTESWTQQRVKKEQRCQLLSTAKVSGSRVALGRRARDVS